MDGSKQWQENLRHLSTKNFELNFEATTIKSRRKGIDPDRGFPSKREKGEKELVCVFSFDASERRWRKEKKNATRRNIVSTKTNPFRDSRRRERIRCFRPFFHNLLIYSTNSLRFMECKLSTILFPLGWTVACNASIYHPEIDGNRSFLFRFLTLKKISLKGKKGKRKNRRTFISPSFYFIDTISRIFGKGDFPRPFFFSFFQENRVIRVATGNPAD